MMPSSPLVAGLVGLLLAILLNLTSSYLLRLMDFVGVTIVARMCKRKARSIPSHHQRRIEVDMALDDIYNAERPRDARRFVKSEVEPLIEDILAELAIADEG